MRLLDKNQKNRLKIAQVKEHKFFQGIDFDDIYHMRVIPPFVPDVKNEDEFKYIDPGLEKEKAEDSQVNNFSLIMAKGNINININILRYRVQRFHLRRG